MFVFHNVPPAPGHYNTEKVNQSPRYSFGVKTVAKVISNSPGKIFIRKSFNVLFPYCYHIE